MVWEGPKQSVRIHDSMIQDRYCLLLQILFNNVRYCKMLLDIAKNGKKLFPCAPVVRLAIFLLPNLIILVREYVQWLPWQCAKVEFVTIYLREAFIRKNRK